MIFGKSDGQYVHNLNDKRISEYNQLNNYQDFQFQATEYYENRDYVGFFALSTRYLLHSPLFIALLAIIGITTAIMGVFFGIFTTAVVSRRVKMLEFIRSICAIFKSF